MCFLFNMRPIYSKSKRNFIIILLHIFAYFIDHAVLNDIFFNYQKLTGIYIVRYFILL